MIHGLKAGTRDALWIRRTNQDQSAKAENHKLVPVVHRRAPGCVAAGGGIFENLL